MPTVAEIAQAVGGSILGDRRDMRINGVAHDSRTVQPGDLFAVLKGEQTDGRRFVGQATKRGAVALLVDQPVESELPQIEVTDARRALGLAAAECYGRPTEQLKTVGITGTNGKTTTAYLVESALIFGHARPGVMGTIEYRMGSTIWPAAHTTPEASVVQKVAHQMVRNRATHLVMEVSSHGLALDRLRGCRFDVAAFTNLTQDHLDFHGTMADYAAAKLLLFTQAIADHPQARIVVNADDPFAETIVSAANHDVMTVSCSPVEKADIRPTATPTFTIDGFEIELHTPAGPCGLRSALLGPHNLANSLLALGIALQLGIDPEQACQGISALSAVPGRLQRVRGPGEFAVLVDYAHTPDALERVLRALRPLTRGRLICVFGCGGDRDPVKRPLMGRAVGEGADIGVVTSDNPRTEAPEAIVKAIVPGIEQTGLPAVDAGQLQQATRGFTAEVDRRRAIILALQAARAGDTILIAGKGHEDYQILGTKKIHFDDREEALAVLRALAGRGNG